MKTSLAPGSKVVTDYLDAAGLTKYLDQLNFQSRRLRLHHVHRQQRAASRRDWRGHQGQQSRRRFRAQRKSQFRGPHSSAGARKLSGFAAAGRGLRARRAHGFRYGHRIARQRQRRQAGFLRDIWPSPQEIESTVRASVTTEMYTKNTAKCSRATPLEIHESSRRRSLRVGCEIHVHQEAAVL